MIECCTHASAFPGGHNHVFSVSYVRTKTVESTLRFETTQIASYAIAPFLQPTNAQISPPNHSSWPPPMLDHENITPSHPQLRFIDFLVERIKVALTLSTLSVQDDSVIRPIESARQIQRRVSMGAIYSDFGFRINQSMVKFSTAQLRSTSLHWERWIGGRRSQYWVRSFASCCRYHILCFQTWHHQITVINKLP